MRMRPSWDGCRVSYITTNAKYRDRVMADAAARGQEKPGFFHVLNASRWEKARLIYQAVQVLLVVLRVRPDVVISTGAAPGYLAIRLGRLMGARAVWVDSIANAEELSLSGRKAGAHSDLWLTQWEHLEGCENPERNLPGFKGSIL